MNKSKIAIIANATMGKIASINGYFWGVLMLLVLLFGSSDDLSKEETIGANIICIIIIAFCVFLIIKGIRIKKRIKRFKKYIALISAEQMTSLENIAANTNESVEFVKKDLQTMIKKKFFANATIDNVSNEIIIGDNSAENSLLYKADTQAELEAYTCPGCDASGNKPKGKSITCEYCGSAV